MKTVHATSFAGLREDLDKKLDECRSSKAQPNFELAKCISEAKKKLEELIALEQGPADVLKSMTEVFMMRDNYKVYLEQIEAGLDKLSKAKADYQHRSESRGADTGSIESIPKIGSSSQTEGACGEQQYNSEIHPTGFQDQKVC